MIQDIWPHIYHCEYDASAAPGANDRILAYTGEGLSLKPEATGDDVFIKFSELCASEVAFRYLFAIDDTRFFMPEAELPIGALPEGVRHTPIYALGAMKPTWVAFAGIMGNSLYQWYRSVRFCGCCGSPMKHSETERAAVCPECKLVLYPRISPVVIVGVTNGDKLLLTRYANGPHHRYALVAGFSETGETLEDTVRREVFEETGIRVKNIRYYKSQPWGLSSSLLSGFFCELDGDDTIHVDRNELAEALWLPRGEIPPRELDIALTSEMIELFRTGG